MTPENFESDRDQSLSIAIVAGKFNLEITERLIDGAKSYLESQGVAFDSISTYWVPGAYEIPFACSAVAKNANVDGIITLGAVVRGGTPHFEFVAGCLLYTSPSPRDSFRSRMPSSA